MFESCVILDGSKTELLGGLGEPEFESCVILDGSKTCSIREQGEKWFERCVILRGNQAKKIQLCNLGCIFLYHICIIPVNA